MKNWIFVMAIAAALAFTLALTLTGVVAAGACSQDLLGPVDDLIAVGSDNVHSAGNSGQSSQNLQNGFHRNNLHNQILLHSV